MSLLYIEMRGKFQIYHIKVSSRFQYTQNKTELTVFVGDSVGTSVGLRGAILGLGVGCSLGLLVVTGLSEGCDDGE